MANHSDHSVSTTAKPLEITFLYGHMRFSGGRKALRNYADFLRTRGHAVREIARNSRNAHGFGYDVGMVEQVDRWDRATIPTSDLIVASEHDEVRAAVASDRGRVVHFCQGFQIHDYEHRLTHGLLPERYQSLGWGFRQLAMWRQKWKWQRRIKEFDAIYRLPTWLVCCSRELSSHLKSRYGRPVELAEYGIHDVFQPPAEPLNWDFNTQNPCRILCVGSIGTLFKGIRDSLEAVAQVKSQGLPVHFVRVSPDELTPVELRSGIVDEHHTGLTQQQMADMFRSCHLYLSNSHPGEGFGMPAMEALRTGRATVLSDIPSYRSFGDHRSFTRFVPVGQPEATVAAIQELLDADPTAIRQLQESALDVSARFTVDNANRCFESALNRIAHGTSVPQTRAA